MLMQKKIRLKPNKHQESVFIEYSHVTRFAHNALVEYFYSLTQAQQQNMRYSECLSYLRSLNAPWLSVYPESILKQTANVFVAKAHYYISHGRVAALAPMFWKKAKVRPLFNILSAGLWAVDDTHVHVVGMHKPIKHNFAVIRNATSVRIYNDGKYWYLVYDTTYQEARQRTTGERLGVDLGIRTYAFCSNWEQYDGVNNQACVAYLKDYIYCLSRQITHRKKYNGNKESKNVLDLRKKLALAERRLYNIRNNFLHEVTSKLTRNTIGSLVIEDLNIPAMLRNEELAPMIEAQQFDRFRYLLTYKCQKKGVKLIVADRFFPSTKKCSNCNYVVSRIPLSARTYHCPRCKHAINRDANAAINLANYTADWQQRLIYFN